jgi:hypothetical protein
MDPDDISKPDLLLVTLVAAVAGASMATGPQPDLPAQQRMLDVAHACCIYAGRVVATGG